MANEDLQIIQNHLSYFTTLCQDAKTPENLLTITSMFENAFVIGHYWDYKQIYNKYIGWGLASYSTCKLIYNYWEFHKECTFIDVGAGTGIFCSILHFLGIPKEKLLAIDLIENQIFFWPIKKVDINYEVETKDSILFISWGTDSFLSTIENYIQRGGSKIIILGELKGGCTFPCDFFEYHSQFEQSNVAKLINDEFLTINLRREDIKKLFYWNLDLSFYLKSFADINKVTDEIINIHFNCGSNDARRTLFDFHEYRDPKVVKLQHPIVNGQGKYYCKNEVSFGPTQYSLDEMITFIQKSIAGSEPWLIISKITSLEPWTSQLIPQSSW